MIDLKSTATTVVVYKQQFSIAFMGMSAAVSTHSVCY